MPPATPAAPRSGGPLLLTSFEPDGHYSRGLARAAWALGADDFQVCTSRAEPPHADPRVHGVWWSGPSFRRDVLRFIDTQRPSLVHLQHEFTMFGGAASALQVPGICDSIRRRDVPLIATVHAVPPPAAIDRSFVRAFTGRNRIPAALLRLAIGWTLRAVARRSSAIIVHSEGLAATMREAYGAPPDRMHVLPLGVPDVPREVVLGRPTAGFTVACPGYVSRRKGLETVVDGFAAFAGQAPDARLRFVGGVSHPKYATELRRRADRLGVADAIEFTGMLPYPAFMQALADASVVVLGAAFSYSASQPLAQARTAGRAVIAPHLGTFPASVTEGIDALLHDPRDPESLAGALATVHRSPDLRARLEAGSRGDADRRSWHRVAAATLNLYAGIQDCRP